MTVKKSLIPRSRATNAYDLLGDVIEAMREEPARACMDVFAQDADEWHSPLIKSARKPTCGTVAAIRAALAALGAGEGE